MSRDTTCHSWHEASLASLADVVVDEDTAQLRILVGRNIRAARLAAGLSQSQLALRLDPPKDRTQIVRWEAGRIKPATRNLKALAYVLNRPWVWFLESHAHEDMAD